MKTYNPTAPEEIKSCMADLQDYIKREDTINALIKLALLHYQFEAIHLSRAVTVELGVY